MDEQINKNDNEWICHKTRKGAYRPCPIFDFSRTTVINTFFPYARNSSNNTMSHFFVYPLICFPFWILFLLQDTPGRLDVFDLWWTREFIRVIVMLTINFIIFVQMKIFVYFVYIFRYIIMSWKIFEYEWNF